METKQQGHQPSRKTVSSLDEDERREEKSSYVLQRTYERIRQSPSMTLSQRDDLLAHMRECQPNHYPVFFLMSRLLLWLPVILGLQVSDCDVRGRMLRISRGWGDCGEYPIPNPTKKANVQTGTCGPLFIPFLSDEVTACLEEVIQRLNRPGAEGTTSWLFPGPYSGRPWNISNLNTHVIRPALQQVGIPEMYPKELFCAFVRVRVQELLNHGQTGSPL